MRSAILSLAAAAIVALSASEARAQYWYGNTRVVPYVTPFASPYPFNYSTSYASPWGYSSFYNTGTYPTPWGFNAYQTQIVRHRPVVQGPYHSIYFDPFTYTYRYAPGFRNAPTYSYRYRVGF